MGSGLIVTWVSCLLWFSVPPGCPQLANPKENHTEISISYKADWPIRSGYLLALVAYIDPLFWSMLAMWLLFQWGRSHPAVLVVWAGVEGINFLHPSILLFSLHHFYFLSGFPAYTSWLANQRLFKTWLTEYRQFSSTTTGLYKIFACIWCNAT